MPGLRERLCDPVFLTRVFLLGGALLRVWHYALGHIVWYDEAVLLVNITTKSYGELLGPLHAEVAAPPVYLWALRTVHVLFGDQPYVWRAVALITGLASLAAVAPLARAVLTPHAAAFAVGLVAVSDDHIRQTVTVKPYTLDMLVATGLLFGLVRTAGWPLPRRLLALAAVTPVALCTSYPAAFVAGGVLLALWPNDRRSATAWLVAGAVLVGTFALLYFGPIRAQRVVKLVNEWERHFMPVRDPAAIPWWVTWHTFGVFTYMSNPAAAVLTVLAPVGWSAFWRGGQRRLAVALAALFAAVLAAAAVRSYPYGQNRLMLFACPAVVLLGARGVEVLARWRAGVAVGLATAVICVSDGLSLWRAAVPILDPDVPAAARYVREHRQPGDAILSDEGNYLYYIPGEVGRLADAAAVPVGGRAWVLMDHAANPHGHGYPDGKLGPLGFVVVSKQEYREATAFLYQRR